MTQAQSAWLEATLAAVIACQGEKGSRGLEDKVASEELRTHTSPKLPLLPPSAEGRSRRADRSLNFVY